METPLHAFADAHDGVVTVAAARGLGYDWSLLRDVVRAEGWVRVAPSAYAQPTAAGDLRTRVRAEQLRHGVLVASHRTAAALHGGDVLVPGFDFIADTSSRFDVPNGTLYRWHLAPGDVVDLDGLRVTSPVRTATDLLRALPRDEAVIAVDGLLRTGTVTLDAVASRLRRLARHRHVTRAWRAFARLDPAAESVAESKARLVLYDAGLLPATQVPIDVGGRRVRVDLWFPERVAVEVEGFAYHSTREQHQADVARFNALARGADVTVLRFSWADVFHRPRVMVAAVRAALAFTTGERRQSAHGDR
jgi:very-short-patch-repair endonuclease